MDLGEYYPCLKVDDIAASMAFYQKLNFKVIGDYSNEGWAVLQHNNMALCLYQGHIKQNLINFRGGDIREIVKKGEAAGLKFKSPATFEEDGSWGAEIIDPDGNVIYFNTSQKERDEYLQNGRLIDY